MQRLFFVNRLVVATSRFSIYDSYLLFTSHRGTIQPSCRAEPHFGLKAPTF